MSSSTGAPAPDSRPHRVGGDAAAAAGGGRASARLGRAEDEVRDPHRLFLLDVGDVSHDDVDQGVLHQAEKHEHCAPGHEHVDGLKGRERKNLSIISNFY